VAETVKRLDEASLKKLKALEGQLGCCVVAFEPPPRPARLTDAQLVELRAMEKELKAVLVAYSG
jgi:hypothetical protein